MKKPETIYTPEKKKERLSLTPEQKDTIRNITLGIEEIDETIRSLAVEDVIKTLENGNLLNRTIVDQDNKIIGYIACEDFVPHEAYIKYLGTTKQIGRNLMQEIPAFIEYAKQQGYTKLNFHGWNDRLNRILERYGFQHIRTDNMADFSVDFYEKNLVGEKSPEIVNEERKNAFEQKYLNKINQEYQQTLATFTEDNREAKEGSINEAFQEISRKLAGQENFEFGDRQKAILKLKLARHFQNSNTCDLNVLFDAIIESPKFIQTDKGSFHRLFEVHEQKTLQKIAEIRKERAEMTGNESFNPYEALFETKSGKYYMARLLNMPHLKEESEYMNHCVGTSDSYVNKMKRGEVEILSFRNTPTINKKANKLEGDMPVITIEYNRKTKVIEQMKKNSDEYLNSDDPYYADIIDALKQLRKTETDTGELRDFSRISPSELGNFAVKDYHILTENGEVSFRDFDPDGNVFALKMGMMEITPETPKKDACKIMKIMEDIECAPDQIAYGAKDINENTKAYIGPLFTGIFQKNIEHMYTAFPEGKIQKYNVEIGGKDEKKIRTEFKEKNIYISEWADDLLKKVEYQKSVENTDLVRLTVRDLGFDNGATTNEIYLRAQEFGLELCPAEVGPELRLALDSRDWMLIAMKQITGHRGSPSVFRLSTRGDQLDLSAYYAEPGERWSSAFEFVFCLRK